MSYLRRFPIDTLKIDRSFVRTMGESDSDRIIVRATIELARNLGLKVIAEGVENEGTLVHLEALACDQAQGYFTGRPMPLTELERWFAESPWASPD